MKCGLVAFYAEHYFNSALCARHENFQNKQLWGTLSGQSAAEFDAADVLSDTGHKRAHALRFHWPSPSLSLFCPLIPLFSAMWRLPTCEDVGSESQLPPTQLPTHILYQWHSPLPVVLSGAGAEIWRWFEDLQILFYHYTWNTAAIMIIAKNVLLNGFHYQVSLLCSFQSVSSSVIVVEACKGTVNREQ